MIEILIFAAIAFFIYKKLFSAFGDTSFNREDDEIPENERKKIEEFQKSVVDMMETKRKEAKQINIISGAEAELRPEDRLVFDEIRGCEPGFSADKFLKGVGIVHETLIKAFSQDDRETLEAYLEKSFFANYENKMDAPENYDRIPHITITRVVAIKVFDSKIYGGNTAATIATRIVTEQIKVIKDRNSGEIVGGNPSKVMLSDEIWSFTKQFKNRDIWKLAGIAITGTGMYTLREGDEEY